MEYKEAIEAVIEGFRDEEARTEEQRRSLAALVMWRKFMVGLRIKERVDGYEVEGEGSTNEPVEVESGMARKMNVDDYGGGFLAADEGDGMGEREQVDIYDRLHFLQPGEKENIETEESVNTHDLESKGLGEKGEDTDDDDGGGFVLSENDSGMESEDYIDDGGGGFLSE